MRLRGKSAAIHLLGCGAVLAVASMLAAGTASAQTAGVQGGGTQEGYSRSVHIATMEDVARMIRGHTQWEILDAKPRQRGSEMRYRFKLINSTGRVRIISIDPENPNLRKLQQ